MSESKRASVEIDFLDVEGHPVEPILDIGGNYSIIAEVINRTITRGNYPWEAELEVGVGISLDGVDILPYTIYPPVLFEPGQQRNYHKKVIVHPEWAGLSGNVVANIYDPFNGVLASAKKRFEVGFEVSPESIYQLPSGIVKGVDVPFLSPDLDLSEGQVVMGVDGAARLPPAPALPKPKPVYNPNDKRVPAGLDCTSEPEPPAEWEGETVSSSGRLG